MALTLVFSLGSIGMSGVGFLAPSSRALFLFGASGAVAGVRGRALVDGAERAWLHGGVLHIFLNMMAVRQLAPGVAELYGPGRMVHHLHRRLGRRLRPELVRGGVHPAAAHPARRAVHGRRVGADRRAHRRVLAYSHRTGSTHGQELRQLVHHRLVLIGFFFPGIDNYAHAGGFAGGYLAARLLDPLKPERIDHVILGVACIGLSLVSIVVSVLHGRAVHVIHIARRRTIRTTRMHSNDKEQSVRLAYQGEPGAYSEAAALQYGGPQAETLPCKSFEDVFDAVAKQRATHGVVPLENSIGGTIHRNYDLLLDHDLSITGEVELDVVHCLQALPGTKIEEVKVVYSHPQALAQCERYLKDLGVTVEAVYDTAGGAKLVAEKKLAGAAALASRRAADVFGLEVLQEAVQDFEFNITRFAIIGGAPPADANKTTIVFALPSTPGALFKALSVFALRDINLTKLESRPMRGRPWEYLFYVEVDAPRSDLGCARALTHLAEFARWTRVLGTYKGAERRTAP